MECAEPKAERNGVKRSESGAESGIAGDAVRCDCDGAKASVAKPCERRANAVSFVNDR